jgi:large conductance mechanosensitive channel
VFKEFREFAARGNVIDLAVGVIIGAAFGKIVSSLVNDVIMPPVGMIVGQTNFRDLFVSLGGGTFASLAEAQASGAPTINYGLFLNTVFEFLIVALVVFLMVRQINRLKQPPPTAPVEDSRPCPFCVSTIPAKASRCPFCTSEVGARTV